MLRGVFPVRRGQRSDVCDVSRAPAPDSCVPTPDFGGQLGSMRTVAYEQSIEVILSRLQNCWVRPLLLFYSFFPSFITQWDQLFTMTHKKGLYVLGSYN